MMSNSAKAGEKAPRKGSGTASPASRLFDNTPTQHSRDPFAATDIQTSITTAIVDHHLPPGTKLGEEMVAEFFQVGRPRVREVFQRLSHEGLITLQPNRGAFVTVPSLKDGSEICEARRVIELETVRMAIRKASAKDIERLDNLTRQEMQAWSTHQRHEAVRLSRQFHIEIAMLAGNSILLDTIRMILHRNTLSVAHYVRRGFSGCMCDEHMALVEAMGCRDEENAVRIMSTHLHHIEEVLTAASNDAQIDVREALQRSMARSADA